MGTMIHRVIGGAVTSSMLERRHKAHPEWGAVESGNDLLAPRFMVRLIRVPSMDLAGWSVGPAWLAERPDAALQGMIAAIMDESPERAIGGNVLDCFRLTIDYPHAAAWFRGMSDFGRAAP